MNPDQWIKVLDEVLSIIRSLLWPGVVVFALIHFGPALKKFLDTRGTVSVEAVGVKVTLDKQLEAATALVAAEENKPTTPGEEKQVLSQDQVRNIASTVSEASSVAANRQNRSPRILWVDDSPSNNVYERRALEALGMRVMTSLSTEDALAQLQSNKFDVIISDMDRPSDSRAGYTLLDKLRAEGNNTPFIIYTSSSSDAHSREAQQRGAQGNTGNPQELIRLVTSALQVNSRM